MLADLPNGATSVTVLGGSGCAGSHDQLLALGDRLKAPMVHALIMAAFPELNRRCRMRSSSGSKPAAVWFPETPTVWAAVTPRCQLGSTRHPAGGRPPPWLLSGLERGTCTNRRTVLRDRILARVLAGLKHRLLAPELVATFVAEYIAEGEPRESECDVPALAAARPISRALTGR